MHMSVDVNNNTCFQKQICRLLHTHTKSNSSYVLGERDHPKSNSVRNSAVQYMSVENG